MKTVYHIQENGTVTTDSKAKTVHYRKSTCNGCGFSQTTIMSYEQDRNLWRMSHTLSKHESLKAFNSIMGNPMEALEKLVNVSGK